VGQRLPCAAAAGKSPSDALRAAIYEQRVLAETAISRPVMQQFKAEIRAQGLFSLFVPAVAADD
jgi:hypothetical protein